MSMFPGPHAQVYYNDAGEPLGWDYPSEPEYCSECGGTHSSYACPYDPYDNDGEPFEEDLEPWDPQSEPDDEQEEANEGTASE